MSKRNYTNIIINMLAQKHVIEDILGSYHLTKVLTNNADVLTDDIRTLYQHIFDVDASTDETIEYHVSALLNTLLEVNQQLMILFEGVKHEYAPLSTETSITYETCRPFKADKDTYTQVTFTVSDEVKAVFQYPVPDRVIAELGLDKLIKEIKERDEHLKENDIQ